MDNETKDFVVLVKGTIVAIDTDGNLVPANGGDTTNGAYTYTMNDQNAGVRKADGTLAIAGETVAVTANIPVGVLPLDVFQDTKGRYLNYKLQSDAIGILCERVVEVPYFTYADLGSPSTVAEAVAAAKAKCNALAYAQTADGNLANNDFVQSDANGKFIKWTPANVSAPTAYEIQQIVGQVLWLTRTSRRICCSTCRPSRIPKPQVPRRVVCQVTWLLSAQRKPSVSG
jgi:hypothetical protein